MCTGLLVFWGIEPRKKEMVVCQEEIDICPVPTVRMGRVVVQFKHFEMGAQGIEELCAESDVKVAVVGE